MAKDWRDSQSRSHPPVWFGLEQGPRTKHAQPHKFPRPGGDRNSAPPAESYQVSRLIVRAAVGKLVDESLLARVRGKGAFTVGQRTAAQPYFQSFSEEPRRHGYASSADVLAAERRPLDTQATVALGLVGSQPGFYLARLRPADDVPPTVERGWYNPNAVPGLLELTGSVCSKLAGCSACRLVASRSCRAEWPARSVSWSRT